MIVTRKFLDLSTAHVSVETRDWLNAQGLVAALAESGDDPTPAIPIARHAYGWFVYADEEVMQSDKPPLGIPADLWICMKIARVHDCEYILFDADAGKIEGLPTFDW
jgi:hypothetical protein